MCGTTMRCCISQRCHPGVVCDCQHHIQRFLVLVVIFGLCVEGHYSGGANEDEGSLLAGANVCNRNETIQGCAQRSVSYPCVSSGWVRCNNRRNRYWRWRGHWRRRWCKTYRHRLCRRMEWHCKPVQAVRKFCCAGYEETSVHTCQRSSPCSVNNGGCEQLCHHTNNEGHECSCFHGYEKIAVNGNCKDVNECIKENGGCNQLCINTPGSYYCLCARGYSETSNNCTDVNECLYGNGGCEHSCINTPGNYHCHCQKGYRLSEKYYCLDINECSTNNGGCSHTCQNIEGTYECECPMGFKLQADNQTCKVSPRPTLPTPSVRQTETTSTNITDLPSTPEQLKDTNIGSNANVTDTFALSSKRDALFQIVPVVGTLSFFVIIILLTFVAIVCWKNCRKRATDAADVYSVPTAAHDQRGHIYAVPVLFDMLKKPRMESGKNEALAFNNPGYDNCINEYEDIIVSAYDYPNPIPPKE